MTIVASAGNGYSNLNGSLATVSADLPNVISVGATSIRPLPEYPQEGAYDVLADYSNWGASITLVAPGGDLTPVPPWLYYYMNASVLVDPVCAASANCPVGYALFGGTSGASPHVAAVAGLIIDQNPGLNPHQVRAILKQTAENLGDRQLFGHGMVDAFAAVSK